MSDQFRIVLNRTRASDQIALDFIAAFLGQECELLSGFDPLGNDRKLKPAAEADDRPDDRG